MNGIEMREIKKWIESPVRCKNLSVFFSVRLDQWTSNWCSTGEFYAGLFRQKWTKIKVQWIIKVCEKKTRHADDSLDS